MAMIRLSAKNIWHKTFSVLQLFGLVSSMVLFCSGSSLRREKREKLIVVDEPEFVEVLQVDRPPPRPPKPQIIIPVKLPYVETNL